MQRIKVSFCVPMYNAEKYIELCIASIANQIDDHILYEIVCVDDCSNDSTRSVVRKLAESNGNIKLICQNENQGVSSARNRALIDSLGEYIWFVDADDMLTHGSVKKFVVEADCSKADIVLGNYVRVNDDCAEPFMINEEASFFNSCDNDHFPKDKEGMPMCAIWGGYSVVPF